MNDYYSHGGYPATNAAGASASMRAELDSIASGFDKLPPLAGNALKTVRVNAAGTALETSNAVSIPVTSLLLKGDGAGGLTTATSSTDYAPATTGSALLKANGSGGFSAASAGTDYLAPAAIGVTVQGYDATTLKSAAIGVTVQAYDANTAKTNATQTFSTPQRGTLTTDNDLSFDLSVTNYFSCTPSAGGTLTFTNIPTGQPVAIKLVNGSNYAIAAAATTKISTADLTKISATGTYLITGLSDGTNVYLQASANLA